MEKATAKSTPAAEGNTRAAEAPQRREAEFHPLLRLQSAIGNQALQRLLQGRMLQAKLAVSHPTDAYEQEADRIAEQMVGVPEPKLQHPCACGGECPRCRKKTGKQPGRLQAKSAESGKLVQTEVPPIVNQALSKPGRPLDAVTRGFFEPRLGTDLGGVRVHTDSQAGAAARAVRARAFTVGPDVVFAQGQFQPHNDVGKRLIGHELTHVVQQSGQTGNTLQRAPEDNPNESEIQSYVFAGDKRLSTDKDFARRSGQDIAARLRTAGSLSRDLRLELNGMLAFFKDDAKDVYIQEIKPALVQVTSGQPEIEIEMPAEAVRPQSYVFAGDKRLSTDKDFARLKGQEIAARIRKSVAMSWEDRLELDGMLAFFKGEAREAYNQEIKPALASLEPSPKEFVERFRKTTLAGSYIDSDKLAEQLSAYVASHKFPYPFIRKVFAEISPTIEDNVAAALVNLLEESKLQEFAGVKEGRATLDILYEAMITGKVSDFQRKQAQRILEAKKQRIPQREYVAKAERPMIFPVRNIGITRDCSATFRAELLSSNGKVKVRYTSVRVHNCDMFKEEVKTLPGYSATMNGFELDPDEIVFVKLYDQGKQIIPIPALALIDFSNEIQEATIHTAETAFALGFTLGVGGLGAAGVRGFGGRALLWADRVAWAIPAISMVVNDHRDWILETFPNAGPGMLDALDQANRIAGYYGMGRLGYDGIRFLKSKVSPAWESWRAAPERRGLNTSEQKLVRGLDDNLENLVNDLNKAENEAVTQAVQYVHEHPEVVKGKPGQRRARVDESHEIVEVSDPSLPTGIGCEIHSDGPIKIPCPDGPMGNPETQPGEREAPPQEPRAPAPTAQNFQLRTNEVLIEGDYPIVIVDTPTGPGARYPRSGKGSAFEEVTPGDPGPGDWVPYYGHAKTVEVGELEDLLAANNMTLADFMKLPQEGKEGTILLFVRDQATSTADWYIKPRAGRWGNPGEVDFNRQLSPWLQRTYPQLPPGQVVTDVKVINDWLRRNGVRVGGDYRVGDFLTGEPFTVIVDIP